MAKKIDPKVEKKLAALIVLLNNSTEYDHDSAEIVKLMDSIEDYSKNVAKIARKSTIDVTVDGEIVFTFGKGKLWK